MSRAEKALDNKEITQEEIDKEVKALKEAFEKLEDKSKEDKKSEAKEKTESKKKRNLIQEKKLQRKHKKITKKTLLENTTKKLLK